MGQEMNQPARVGNPRFFTSTGPHSIAAVACAAGCAVPTVADTLLTGLASLEAAGPDDVSLAGSSRHTTLLSQTRAGAVLVSADLRSSVPDSCIALVIDDPIAAWAQVALLFHPLQHVRPGIHRSASVADDASVDPTAEIGPQAVIEAGAEIGPRCRIGPGAVIGEGVMLGADCRIGAHATVSHAVLGARVYIYPGARIGQEGFGFTITLRGFQTVPQLGLVILEDDVEIGANTTIDRGSMRDTVIGAGTRIDNLVQVAHNVRIGRHCAIAAQVGISGSAEIEDFVVIGGQAGIADHLCVGARTRIGAQAGVMTNIQPGAVVVGSPARPSREVFREIAVLRKLARGNRA
jgi:UDP-3-O-[3-hydroxymyristoyl] glucosamine N-acyltransferase